MQRSKQDQDRLVAIDALSKADVLYDQYLELARIADVTNTGSEQLIGDPSRSWEHPIGVVGFSGELDAVLE